MNINTSLLRERFLIRDMSADADDDGSRLNLDVRSNRMAIHLSSGNMEPETFVVRAHNMHSCARMVSRIINTYNHIGPISNRNPPFDWDEAWNMVIDDYERAYVPEHWVAVYHKGRVIYNDGEEHHVFLDIIEKCDAVNKGEYEKSIKLAEDAFNKAGKKVNIDYSSNIALVVDIERFKGRCGMILRGPERTTTFNMVLESEDNKILDASQCMTASSAFLEGIQLAFKVGINLEKINQGQIEAYSPEEKATREARRRLGRLNAEINALQNNVKVRYRPERPDFFEIVTISERIAQKTLLSSEESYQSSYGDGKS